MIFLNSASSAAVLVFYLPVCVHTLAPRENRVRDILKSSKKMYLMNVDKFQFSLFLLYYDNFRGRGSHINSQFSFSRMISLDTLEDDTLIVIFLPLG